MTLLYPKNDLQIVVADLWMRFGKTCALRGLAFSTQGPWRCLGVLGRNGAGKTTFLRLLTGLLQPSTGTLCVMHGARKYAHADARMATYIPENQSLISVFTGHQYLSLYEAMNTFARVRTDSNLRNTIVSRLELTEHLDKPIGRMSKGTRRKLELVAALSTDVPMMVADEIGEGLDVPTREEIKDILKCCMSCGKKFVLSSHDLSFILEVCDTLAIIDQGRCIDLIGALDTTIDSKARVIAAFNRDKTSY